jgi:nucleotide-binding universal stress UspA family protein
MARTKRKRSARPLNLRGYRETGSEGRAYREILRTATEEEADLIVMGGHGRGALDLLLFGSTTHHVVRASTCPVLIVRQS